MPRPCPEGHPHKHPANLVETLYWLCLPFVVGAHLNVKRQRRG